MQQSRPLLAMLICLGLFLFFLNYQRKIALERQKAEDVRRANEPQAAAPAGERQPPNPAAPGAVPGGNAGAVAEGANAARVGRPAYSAKTELIKTDELELTIDSSRGGGISRVILNDYNSAEDPEAPLELFAPSASELPALALELVRLDGEDSKAALSGEAWSMTFDARASRVVFENSVNVEGGRDAGLLFTKRVVPGSAPYQLDVRVEIKNRDTREHEVQYRLAGPYGLRSEATRSPGHDINVVKGEIISKGPPKVESYPVNRENNTWTGESKIGFLGMKNNYFTAILAAVDQAAPPEELTLASHIMEAASTSYPEPMALAADLQESFPGKSLEDLPLAERRELEEDTIQTGRTFVVTRPVKLAPGQSVSQDYVFFLGPRRDDLLDEYRQLNLGAVNDFGFTSWIVKLFIWILKTFHMVVRNWGLAIVCLTLVVRFSLHPINRKQQAGMMRYQKKIQKIQPQMNEIKERFKEDRIKQNQELQALFKQHGVNPAQMMGGCLMILLQFPIWIGLIETLNNSIDLRQQPFFFWITDLSQPDRFMTFESASAFLPTNLNLLPVAYVILMLVQQRLQPKASDPQMRQTQSMMSIMMIAFGFIFYGFASGLLIYFLTSAVFGIIESRLIKRKLAREEDTDTGPAAAGKGPSGPLYGSSRSIGKPKKAPKEKKYPRMH